jgi:tetratricopeptide (TPR) repeat protein
MSATATTATSESSRTISEARLRKLADFPNFEKTSFWHGHLAEALRKAIHTDAAIKSFETAIELNDKNWIAMGRLSFCYESVQLYELAVEWSRKALSACPTVGHKWERSQYWLTIADGLLELGDIEGAKAAAQEASKLKPEDGDILSTYIFVLDNAENHSELFAYIEDLQSRTSAETDENLLTVAMMANDYVLGVLGHAARAVGKLDFITRAQETVIEAATRDEDFEEVANQQNLLAQLYYTQVDNQKKAVELWELVLKSKDASAYTVGSASDHLSTVYYAEAMASETRKGKGPRHWITKLEKLAKYDHDTHETSASGASLMLGLWYQEHGNITEARNCCRAYVLQALDWLSDDDPYNDSNAWITLAKGLMKAGDRDNAAAADAVVTQEFDKLKAVIAKKKSKASENSEATSTAEVSSTALPSAMTALGTSPTSSDPQPPGAVHPSLNPSYSSVTATPEVTTSDWFCDGQCRRPPETWNALYVCEICWESILFCEQCIDRVKERRLGFRVCDPKHRWYQTYPVREGWGKVLLETTGGTPGEEEKEMIMINGKVVELDIWLKTLREDWTKSGSDG